MPAQLRSCLGSGEATGHRCVLLREHERPGEGERAGDRCACDPLRLCRKYASLPPSVISIAPFSVMNKKWKENAMIVIPDAE